MDCKDGGNAAKSVSFLQGDRFFYNRIISRQSTVGFSSRIYYRSSAEGVPFKWETKPGRPKKPAEDDIIPPLNPPPALQCLSLLPKKCCINQEAKDSRLSRFWFWKKSKKNKEIKVEAVVSRESKVSVNGSQKFEKFEFGSSVVDRFFYNRIISRQSTVGFSSRIYYRSSAEGVPFKWETKPGKPKKPAEDDIIPPLNPPPALQCLSLLPKKCCINQEAKDSRLSRFWFWKKNKKNKESKKVEAAVSRESKVSVNGSQNFEKYEFCSSDGEFFASPRNSSSLSSSSSSLSSINDPNSLRSRHERPTRVLADGSFSCTPWINISTILVGFAKRV